MKYLDTYRDPRAARDLLDAIGSSATRPWALLEVCGGPARSPGRFGADRGLPGGLELIHGPGDPVSAAPAGLIDRAADLAGRPGVVVCAPGDLLRVPGSGGPSLIDARVGGADVRAVYSPLDALALARRQPGSEVVVLAVGFETTAPAAAAAVLEADRLGLENFGILPAFFRLAPAVEAVLAAPGRRARAVLAAGPVCAVTGFRDYEPIADRFRTPVVITGPEPLDLLDAIARAVLQLEGGTHVVENQYARAVRPDGNPQALAAVTAVFERADADWRGLGRLAGSGLALRAAYRRFDAASRFPAAAPVPSAAESPGCPDGDVLAGRIAPNACPAFGTRCTPGRPLGASMASVEGTCAAYYRDRRPTGDHPPVPSLAVVPASSLRGD